MQRVRVYVLMIELAAFNIMYLTVDFTNAFNFLHVYILQLHFFEIKLIVFCFCTSSI
jgi:hypothetical protein